MVPDLEIPSRIQDPLYVDSWASLHVNMIDIGKFWKKQY